MKILLAPVLLLVLTALSAGQNIGKSHAERNTEFSNSLDARLSRTATSDHLKGLLKYFDDDTVTVDDEQVTTRKDIERYLTERYGSTLTLKLRPTEAHRLTGKTGYTTGRYSLSGKNDHCDCPVSEQGKYIIVWRLNNSEWRIKSWTFSASETRGCGCANASCFGPPPKPK